MGLVRRPLCVCSCVCVRERVCVCVIKLLYACYRPLHIAAKSGLVGVVKELINRGADLNIRDADGITYTHIHAHVHAHAVTGSIGHNDNNIAKSLSSLKRVSWS